MSTTEFQGTTYGVAPQSADWYWCAIIDRHDGETGYIDGYATGDRPTIDYAESLVICEHSYVAGMMHVHAEDLDTCAAMRAEYGETVECERCEHVYGTPERALIDVLEWEVRATPHGAHADEWVPADDSE